MSFNIPIEQNVDIAISGSTINIPGAVTSSGDVGILRQAATRDLFVTGTITTVQGTSPWIVNGSVAVAGYSDSPSLDAFARLRVSNPETHFENKQIFDKQPLIWSELTGSGGAVTYNPTRASTTLSITGTSGSIAARQTKQRINYQPGKSLLVISTFVFGTGSANVSKKVGYFDNKNGIFFEQSGSNLYLGIRSDVGGTPIDTMVSQSSWNLDPLDGSGPSGITLDISKAQIFTTDVEWLGVGRVRTGFIFNGSPVYAHEFNRANTLTSVYMSTPNLPVRYELTNEAAGSANSLEEICSTVISEGGYNDLGVLRSINRNTIGRGLRDINGLVPLLSIRLKSAYIGTTIIPTDFSIISDSATTYLWQLILNPTVAGVDAASWTDLTNSAIQYDISRTNANSLSGGTVIKSGYVVGQGNTVTAADAGELRSLLVISADINDVPDQLVLAIQRIDNGGSNVNYFAALSWREIF